MEYFEEQCSPSTWNVQWSKVEVSTKSSRMTIQTVHSLSSMHFFLQKLEKQTTKYLRFVEKTKGGTLFKIKKEIHVIFIFSFIFWNFKGVYHEIFKHPRIYNTNALYDHFLVFLPAFVQPCRCWAFDLAVRASISLTRFYTSSRLLFCFQSICILFIARAWCVWLTFLIEQELKMLLDIFFRCVVKQRNS